MVARRPRTEDVEEVDDEQAKEAELESGRMPFIEHLRELRQRLRNAAIVFAIAFIGCWIFSEKIYKFLRVPFDDSWAANAKKLGSDVPEMYFSSPVTPFWLYMSVALWAAIFVASPFIFHQLWKFIAPGLYKRERRIGIWFAIFSGLFFIGGAAFCYYVTLTPLYTFLLSYSDPGIHPTIFIDQYFDLTRDMMLAFGAVFELPMLIYFLASVGLVTHRSLWKFNRWFVVIAFIVGAILTPSPDVVSQILMAVPMILLYNLSILIAYVITKKRERRAAAERDAERAD
jgi:sec-independent protein translocase protein TatC